MQHDLIHHFWWSHRFQPSDLSPWFHCSAVSSLPALHLTWKAALPQPFLTLALSPGMGSLTWGQTFSTETHHALLVYLEHYSSWPLRTGQDHSLHLLAGKEAVWNVSSCFPKISRSRALKLSTWGEAGGAANTMQHPKCSSHVAWHGTARARGTQQPAAFQGWLMPCC